MTSPRVTVLMPVFNREEFVGQAIESVLAQDFADFELLIVDDASTDRTPEVLRIARQWMDGTRVFAHAGQRVEALRFLLRAASWSPAHTIRTLATPAIASVKASLHQSRIVRMLRTARDRVRRRG